MLFSIFTKMCNNHHNEILEYFCCLPTFLKVLFAAQTFNLDEVQFIYFIFFVTCAFGIVYEKVLSNSRSQRLTPICIILQVHSFLF